MPKVTSGISSICSCSTPALSSHSACGLGPETSRPLYVRYTPISEAKNMHSDPMKVQMASFLLSMPVAV